MAVSIDRVEPGELIKASLLNEVADVLEALDLRVAALEADSGGGGGDEPVITDVDPEEPTVGGVMEIHGRRFAVPAGLNTVTLDEHEITSILPGSNQELLRAVVPGDIVGLPKNTTLRVATTDGEATRTVRILPEQEVPEGRPIVTNTTTGIGTIARGTTYTFTFLIDATPVSITETYRLAATYASVVGGTRQQWEDATEFVGTDSSGDVIVTPGTPVTVGVSVTVPAAATSVALTLNAESLHNPAASSASSPQVPIAVGVDQPENDARIPIYVGELPNHLKSEEDEGVLVLQVEYASGAPSRTVLVPIEARFLVSGTFDYDADIEDAGALWTVGSITPSNSAENAGGAQQVNVQLTLRATAPSDERRTLVFSARRREESGPGRISASLAIPIEGFSN